MKKFILALALIAFVCNIGFAADSNFTNENMAPAKIKAMPEKVTERKNITNTPDQGLILQGGDDVASATVIGSLDYTDDGTTEGYSDDYNEYCDYEYDGSPDVVYSFTPAADVRVSMDLAGSAYDTKLYVYENSVTPGSPIACNDDFWEDYTSYISAVVLTAGNTYYIVVDGYDDESFGNYHLAITDIGMADQGDGCDDPLEVDAIPFTDNGNTCDFIDDCDITSDDGPDVIYELVVTSYVRLTVSLLGSSYDTKLAIFQTDCCSGEGNEFAYNDDYGDVYQSQISTFFTPATYYIVVDGYDGDCGDYVLNIAESDPPSAPGCTQSYIGPDDDWAFQTSDTELGPYLVYEDFSCEQYTQLCGVTLYGLHLTNDGTGWSACSENPATMTVSFYDEMLDNIPDFGNPMYTMVVEPTVSNTGIIYANAFEMKMYEITFDDCVPMNTGWISIQGTLNDGNLCAFLWCASEDGNGYAFQDMNGPIGELTQDLTLQFDGYVSVDDNAEALPAAVDMVTNYPNPFNPTTTFAFTIANSGNVAIDIYDVLGRRIDNLDLGYLENNQVHSVEFDASNLATGVYFYNLMVDGEKRASESFSLLK